MLKINNLAFRRDVIGMPTEHAEAFKNVAESNRCIILSRAVGPTCHQLLAMGYDTKGFRIHAKSSNWGPMAGFVVRDPRLGKKGRPGAGYNRREHDIAIEDTSRSGWRASTTQLKLYPERVWWLQNQGYLSDGVWENRNSPAEVFRGTARNVAPDGHSVALPYVLVPETGPRGRLYAVYIDNGRGRARFNQEGSRNGIRRPDREPLLAMTNPPKHRSWPGDDFRNAVTGDYDLFAIWPHSAVYDHDGEDRRVFGAQRGWADRKLIADVLEPEFARDRSGAFQNTKLGNLTDRIYFLSQLLNSTIGSSGASSAGKLWPAHPSRMVLWHSTEDARPFTSDIDSDLIAILPNRKEVGIPGIRDFKEFVLASARAGFVVTLGDGMVLEPDKDTPNRLGAVFAGCVPEWTGGRTIAPSWYNE
jgi:hypothetical protein